MLMSFSLRLRILLLFAGVAAAGILIVCVALFLGHMRAADTGAASGFLFAAILSTFGLLAINAGVWLLFDENVAKPIDKMATTMRTRAYADGEASVDFHAARYLGDLAPAVDAVTGELSKVAANADEIVATETANLTSERAQLASLLSEIPIAIILLGEDHQILLYDGQAAEVLGQIHVPRLSASIFDYFQEAELRAALEGLSEARTEAEVSAHGTRGNLSFDLRIKSLSHTSGYMILIDSTDAKLTPDAARPLTYDFDLAEKSAERAIEDCSLMDINFVVFDTETTGLMPAKDEIVQLGAVRVVNGRIVAGEAIDQLVNPGRAIPLASSKVHGVTDEMVVDAPGPTAVLSDFHVFSRQSVIVAHNAPFDMAFLYRHGKRSGDVWDHPILDTVLLSAVVFGANETHTLDAVCDRLCVTIPPERRHTALGDAQATAEVLCKLLPLLASRGLTTFGAVIAETRKHGRLLKDMN